MPKEITFSQSQLTALAKLLLPALIALAGGYYSGSASTYEPKKADLLERFDALENKLDSSCHRISRIDSVIYRKNLSDSISVIRQSEKLDTLYAKVGRVSTKIDKLQARLKISDYELSFRQARR